MDYEHYFGKRIADLKAEGRYRVFADLERQARGVPARHAPPRHGKATR